jgi:hypothetical protein
MKVFNLNNFFTHNAKPPAKCLNISFNAIRNMLVSAGIAYCSFSVLKGSASTFSSPSYPLASRAVYNSSERLYERMKIDEASEARERKPAENVSFEVIEWQYEKYAGSLRGSNLARVFLSLI